MRERTLFYRSTIVKSSSPLEQYHRAAIAATRMSTTRTTSNEIFSTTNCHCESFSDEERFYIESLILFFRLLFFLPRKPKINCNRKASYLQTCLNVLLLLLLSSLSSLLSDKIVGERILSLRMGRKTPAASDAPPMAMEILRPVFFISDANERKKVFFYFFLFEAKHSFEFRKNLTLYTRDHHTLIDRNSSRCKTMTFLPFSNHNR